MSVKKASRQSEIKTKSTKRDTMCEQKDFAARAEISAFESDDALN
jgi:hypothetical protein